MADLQQFDLIVIGAGPAGYIAAIRAAQLGMTVACVEKEKVGGTCLNVGCIPSKALLESSELYYQAKEKLKEHGIGIGKLALDFKAFMARKNAVVQQLTGGVQGLFKKNKITHIVGTARINPDKSVHILNGKETIIVGKHIIIATGSVPAPLPILPFDGVRIIDSTTALSLTEIPEELAVVGGGYIGLEMGSVYLRLGSKVTVIEALDRIVPAVDAELGLALERSLSKQGMLFKKSTKVVKATVNRSTVELLLEEKNGERGTWKAGTVLVAVGRNPYTKGLGLEELGVKRDERGRIVVNEQYQSTVSGIYAVGDVISGPMLAHKASEEAVALVEMLAGQQGHVNYLAIPSVIYTWPELACVGMTEIEAKELGIEYKTAKFPFMANGRALSMGERDGFVKLIADRRTDRLIGAHILGPRAGDMIAEMVLGIEFSATAEDIARTVHAHPTLSEGVKEAALGLGSGILHL